MSSAAGWVPPAGLLSGVKILDLSLQLPGPYATKLLREMGAQVDRLEPPGGDPARGFASLYQELTVGKSIQEIDLKQHEGRARAVELASGADVLIEGFRPGVLARLGLGYVELSELNPSLVYCSISGYGQTGGRADRPGHDLTYQAEAGLLAASGSASMPAAPTADLAAGLAAAMSICAALVDARSTGLGTWLDVSMFDVAASWSFPAALTSEGDAPDLFGSTPHYGVFATRDGAQVALGIVHEERFWRSFCEEFDLAEGEPTFVDRQRDVVRVRAVLADLIEGIDADEFIRRSRSADVPVGLVRHPEEVLADEGLIERGTFSASSADCRLGPAVKMWRRWHGAGGDMSRCRRRPADARPSAPSP